MLELVLRGRYCCTPDMYRRVECYGQFICLKTGEKAMRRGSEVVRWEVEETQERRSDAYIQDE